MDERADTTLLTRALLVVGAAAVLALPVRDVVGDSGVLVLLLVTLWAVAVLAYADFTGRPLPRLSALRLPWRTTATSSAVVVEDAWRSERWIADAVDRGLRAIDAWRLEQRDA